MKKLALAFISASALVFGFGVVAEAQGYGESLTLPTAPTAGGGYTALYTNCQAGETITFSQPESNPTTVTGTCVATVTLTGAIMGVVLPSQAVLGNATGAFTAAPTAPGTYTVTASGTISPVQTTTFTIAATPTTTTPTTLPGDLPATGSNGVGTTTGIAIGLLVVGVGLFVVAQVRRRQTTVA